jgi:dipeptidyl-peptidase-4
MKLSTLFAVLGLAFVAMPAQTQGARSDYERAGALRQRVVEKVFRAAVTPNWIGESDRFWYRNDLPEGRRAFLLVDPAEPSKRPAFDHARLAAALSKALGKPVEAERLPVDRIAFVADRPVLRVQTADRAYECDLQTYELHPGSPLPPAPNAFRNGARRGGGQNPGRPPQADGSLSPDGKWRVTLRTDNAFLVDAQTGQETPLTQDGRPEDAYEGRPYWSPDSQRLVVFKTVPAQEHKVYAVESSPKDQLQPKLHSFDYLKPGDRIAHPRPHLFDVAAKRDIPIVDTLFPNPWEITDVHWEPDSKRFTFLYNQRGHQAMRLIAVDAETGEAKTLIDEQARTFIDWTNKVYLHRLDSTHEAVWMSERDGWNHLYLYDTATGQVKNQITKGEWVVRGVDRVDDAGRRIWFRAGGIVAGQDPYYVHYVRVNFDGTGLTLLTEGDGTHTTAFSPDNKYLVDTYSRVDLPPVTALRRSEDGGKVLDLEQADASALLATGWRYPERFVARGRDGKTDIYGVIVRPTNFDPARRYPVLESIYAGPQGAFVPKAFFAASGLQSMAELGFIVVQIDGMGTNYRSRAFHDVCWKHLADAGFPDRILWIKAAAAKYPYMDLTRMGIYGTSAGGQNALGGLLLHGDFYRAGVADSGCHDNRMDKIWWNEQWMGWPVGPEYDTNSNVTLAANLKGKLLLMVGEMDTNVDPASTLQVANVLIKANKDFELLVMPGAGHGVAGTPYGRRRLQDFFVRNLLGVEPPDRNTEQRAAQAPSRQPVGTGAAQIRRIDPPEQGFYAKELDYEGIPIKASEVVADQALFVARDRIARMLKNLPDARYNLKTAGAELHIIGKDQVTSDLPEHRHLKGKPFDGNLTVDQRTRGLGGRLTSCGEENLLQLPGDRYAGRDICTHEFAHCIQSRGLSADVRQKIREQYHRSLDKGLWKGAYAATNEGEFFAELTMWYFGTHGDLKMTGPKPANGPEGLKQYDPEAYALLDDLYSGRIPVTRVKGPAYPQPPS